MNDIEKAKYIATYCVEHGINLADDEATWFRIAFALANDLGEEGREIFHALSSRSKKYRYGENEYKYTYALRHSNGSIRLGTLINLAQDAGIQIPGDGSPKPFFYAAKKTPPTPTGKPMPDTWQVATMSHGHRFKDFLLTKFDKKSVAATLAAYGVGGTRSGSTLFWLRDSWGHLVDGRIIDYDSATGNRKKGGRLNVDWVHRHKGWDCLALPLFGAHLLATRPDAPVALVEAEKTALIGSVVIPDMVWVATYGKGGFTAEKITPLVGRKVYIYPDVDAVDEWRTKASRLLPDATFVGDWFRGKKLGPKADLADWWLQALPIDVPQPVLARYPDNTALHRFCDALRLDCMAIATHADIDEKDFKTWKQLVEALSHRA